MSRWLQTLVERGLNRSVSATGLAVFRILFGLVVLHEILFLLVFRHLIFDTLPYLDRASPVLHYFLVIWAGVATCLTLGYRTRWMSLWNYLFWVIFVVYTPMWQDFDGGFDQFMTGSSFLLIFLPAGRALSLDNLRQRLRHDPVFRPVETPPPVVSILAYQLPIAIALGLLYFDSGLHKLSSEFWRNGLGAWLPATMPYYMSALDMSPLLDTRWLEQTIGYSIILFQWVFLFLFWFRPFRVPLLLLGATFHGGIILSLNIYPFGFGMLVHYALLVPFGFWRAVANRIRCQQPLLTVFYDEQCPLCNRTALILDHFDVRRAVAFRGLQTFAADYPALADTPPDTLLKDLYSLDTRGRRYQGVQTYSRILVALGYTAPLGWLMRLPGLSQLADAVYRRIADGRSRVGCDADCQLPAPVAEAAPDDRPFATWYARHAATPQQQVRRISKFLVLILVLQLNSTLHYALLYRWADAIRQEPALALLDQFSDALINVSHTFLGITPHALYMHDHFAGYEHLVGITWFDADGVERWLPFIDDTGRILSPYWGRIQSMWANVAVTSKINRYRFDKLLRKVTAYQAHELGLSLDDARFGIKLKHIQVPMQWEAGLRHRNMAAPWQDVGVMVWHHGHPRLDLGDVDLEALTLH